MADTRPLLEVRDLQGWYGQSHVLHGISFTVDAGRTIALIGRNGAGKTTTLKAIMGLLERRQGTIRLDGSDISGLAPDRVARRGIAYCPEERGIFASLSVEENLMLPPAVAKGGISVDELHDMFPNLAARRKSRGNELSGGEQQMLAIARILRTGARILLLDEPTEGLAPTVVHQIKVALAQLGSRGYTIVLVEQNFHFAADLADQHFVVEDGRVVDRISRDDIKTGIDRLERYLTV